MTRLVVVLGFLVSFAAGLAVGTKLHREPAKPTATRPSLSGWLAAELDLTSDQQQQLNQIWTETASRGGRDREERRRELFREREEQVAALVKPEDKVKYDEAMKTFSDRMSALESEWRGSFQQSVERTKAILTPTQRTKYEEILKRHGFDRGSRERWRGDRDPGRSDDRESGWRGGRHPSSAPTSGPRFMGKRQKETATQPVGDMAR